MKHLVNAFTVHISTIILFTILYFLYSNHYTKYGTEFEMMDYLLLSITVQAGVGITDIYPATFYGKLLLALQQVIMLITNISTIYFFTL